MHTRDDARPDWADSKMKVMQKADNCLPLKVARKYPSDTLVYHLSRFYGDTTVVILHVFMVVGPIEMSLPS